MNAAERLLGDTALASFGERHALVCDGEPMTYAALAGRVRSAAAAYAALGVAPGERVLVLLRDTPDFAAAWLGAVWRGAVPIGLNNKLSDDELRFVAKDSAASLLVTEAALARELGVRSVDASELKHAGDASPQQGPVERPAFWLYSSGTTGKPKGIVHTHRAILAAGQAQREAMGLGCEDRILTTSKLFFAYSLEHGLLGPLSLGAASLLSAGWADVASVCGLVETQQPTAFFSVPSFYRRLLSEARDHLGAFRGIRRFAAAGERLPASVVSAWRVATGGEIQSIYGMSETFCVSFVTRPGTSDGSHTGTPLAGVEARLADADGAPVGEDVPGILWIKHPALAQGYANRADQTKEQFRDGWFCTRDMFVRDQKGNYAHQGRADELVKIAGQWVRPSDVEEAALAESAVAEAACTLVADVDGFERIALFVVAKDAADAGAAAEAACGRTLARHQRPKWIRAVDELPRTATGKVQRFRLREMLERELGLRS